MPRSMTAERRDELSGELLELSIRSITWSEWRSRMCFATGA